MIINNNMLAHTHYSTHRRNNMSNPYSLRAGLLKQAQDILDHAYHSKMDNVRYQCDHDLINPKTVTWPEPPTTEQVLNEAEKLYTFIQKK